MADRKISELNAADAANLHDAALVHVVDLTEALAADQNVKATVAQMKTVFAEGARAVLETSMEFGADDTTGVSVADGATHTVPVGMWWVYGGSARSFAVEVYVNGAWRSTNVPASTGGSANGYGPVLVASDGTNCRIKNTDLASGTFYFRKVLP